MELIIVMIIAVVFLIIAIIEFFKILTLKEEMALMEQEIKDEVKDVVSYSEKRKEEKRKNKKEIIKMFDDDSQLSNREVAKKLGISRSSAFRYLEELEKAGKIKQVGDHGRFVYYTKI